MQSQQDKTKLAEVLQRQGKTIGWLAKTTGYTYKHCWHVATGRAQGSLSFLRHCAEVLAVPTHQLVDDCVEVA